MSLICGLIEGNSGYFGSSFVFRTDEKFKYIVVYSEALINIDQIVLRFECGCSWYFRQRKLYFRSIWSD